MTDIIAINIQELNNAEEAQVLEVLISKNYSALETLQESWILLQDWAKLDLVFTIDIILIETRDVQVLLLLLKDQAFQDKMLSEKAQCISFD